MQIAVVPAVAYGVALVRRGSRWGDQGWLSRQADAVEVAAYRGRLGERCDDAQAPSACATSSPGRRWVSEVRTVRWRPLPLFRRSGDGETIAGHAGAVVDDQPEPGRAEAAQNHAEEEGA